MPKKLERAGSPTADAWMLDIWEARGRHVRAIEARLDAGGDREYRTVCTCGWRSIPTVTAKMDDCEVLEALCVREQRISRDAKEQFEWTRIHPGIGFVVDPAGTGRHDGGGDDRTAADAEVEGRDAGERRTGRQSDR